MYELREISQQRDRIGYMNLNLCCPCSALLNSVLRLPVISVLRRLLFKARIHNVKEVHLCIVTERIGCSLRYYRSSAPQSSRLLPNSPLRCQLRLAFCHHAMPCETHPYLSVLRIYSKPCAGSSSCCSYLTGKTRGSPTHAYCWERLSGCAGTPTCQVTEPRERLSGSDGRTRSAVSRSRVRNRSHAERSGSRR